MGLFSKKCWYCNEKIDKGKELKIHVIVPGYVGKKAKIFCCEEHAEKYEERAVELNKRPSKGCCGGVG